MIQRKSIFLKYFIKCLPFCTTLIFFGMLYKIEYATDTYQVFNFNEEQIFLQYAMSGRFLTALIGKTVKILNFSEYAIYFSSYIMALICIIICQYKLYKILNKDIKSEILVSLICVLIVINPFSIELFLFIEKGVMIFGILMCIYALENLIKYFESKNKRNILYSMIFMFIANCSYQGVVGIFIAIGLVYIIKYSRNIKEFIINNITTFLAYGVPTVIDYVIIKIFYSTSRINGEIIFSESVKKIYENTIEMIKSTYNLLPKYMFFLAILFTFVILCYKIVKEEKNGILHKKRGVMILEYFYIILGTTLISIIPQFMQATSSIWFVPRSTYPFAALYGILILYLSIRFKIGEKTKFAIIIVSILIICMQLQKFILIERDRYILNKEDYKITMQIIDKINDYQSSTGKKINKIEIYEDFSPRYTYNDIFATGDININAYSNDWSTKSILEYYLKENLEQIEKDKNIEEQFKEKNWNEFNYEQIFFKEDILILCRY